MNERAESQGRQAAESSAEGASATVEDQRLVRGARTRRRIARHGVDVASLEGLNGLSIGRLATDLGLSKSGIQTLFKTKENLQLAVAESAREEFAEAVVRPARTAPPGGARLRALTEHWISYVEAPLFAGGCFWAASLPDFDSRPGRSGTPCCSTAARGSLSSPVSCAAPSTPARSPGWTWTSRLFRSTRCSTPQTPHCAWAKATPSPWSAAPSTGSWRLPPPHDPTPEGPRRAAAIRMIRRCDLCGESMPHLR